MHKIKLLSLKQEWATIINKSLKLYTAYSTTNKEVKQYLAHHNNF